MEYLDPYEELNANDKKSENQISGKDKSENKIFLIKEKLLVLLEFLQYDAITINLSYVKMLFLRFSNIIVL